LIVRSPFFSACFISRAFGPFARASSNYIFSGTPQVFCLSPFFPTVLFYLSVSLPHQSVEKTSPPRSFQGHMLVLAPPLRDLMCFALPTPPGIFYSFAFLFFFFVTARPKGQVCFICMLCATAAPGGVLLSMPPSVLFLLFVLILLSTVGFYNKPFFRLLPPRRF